MPRPTKTRVERAFDLYHEMTTDERTAFDLMRRGYDRAEAPAKPKPAARRAHGNASGQATATAPEPPK